MLLGFNQLILVVADVVVIEWCILDCVTLRKQQCAIFLNVMIGGYGGLGIKECDSGHDLVLASFSFFE